MLSPLKTNVTHSAGKTYAGFLIALCMLYDFSTHFALHYHRHGMDTLKMNKERLSSRASTDGQIDHATLST